MKPTKRRGGGMDVIKRPITSPPKARPIQKPTRFVRSSELQPRDNSGGAPGFGPRDFRRKAF